MSLSKHITTITISRSNYLRLIELGKKGDSFDDIVGKLLDHHECHSSIPVTQQSTENNNPSDVMQVKETKK
jgi:predicted CopG family antitoxin